MAVTAILEAGGQAHDAVVSAVGPGASRTVAVRFRLSDYRRSCELGDGAPSRLRRARHEPADAGEHGVTEERTPPVITPTGKRRR